MDFKNIILLVLLIVPISCKKDKYFVNPIELPTSDSTQIEISKGFEELLIEKGYIQDQINDGLVSYGQIKDIDTLKIQSYNWDHYRFTSLKGIEYFRNLRYLNMYGSYVDTVDVSKNIELTYLNCGGLSGGGGTVSTIKFLNVRNCLKLKFLNCSQQIIKILDLSHNRELEELYCGSNDLTSLNLDNNPHLRILDTFANRGIEYLDLSNNQFIEELYVSYNTLADLYIDHIVNLKRLDCSYNYSDFKKTFGKLDISKNIELVALDIAGSRLSEIELSNNTKIELLNISSCNSMTNINVSVLPELKTFICGYSALTTINISHNLNLEFLNINGTLFSEIDLSKNVKLRQFGCLFQNSLTNLDLCSLIELERFSTYKCQNLKTVFLYKLPENDNSNWIKDDWTEYKACW